MRILILTALYPPAVGGAATYFGEIAPRLARQSGLNAVIVLTEAMSGQPRRCQVDGVTILRLLPRRASGPARPFWLHALTYLLTQLWFVLRLNVLVRKEAVDLVHFHTRYGGRPFFGTLRRLNVPVIADLRDKMSAPAALAAVADRLLCCGQGVVDFARAGGFPPERISHLPIPFAPPIRPPAAELATLRHRFQLAAPYVLFAGDLTRNKGIMELLEAFALWRPRHPEVQLLIVGVNRLGRALAGLPAAGSIRYLGPLPATTVLGLMAEAALVVLPSRSEGMPRVILEAIALGTRVICPPHIPEFDQYCQPFVLPHVAAVPLAEMLEKVWQMPKGPAYPLANHNPERVVASLTALYRQLAGPNG